MKRHRTWPVLLIIILTFGIPLPSFSADAEEDPYADFMEDEAGEEAASAPPEIADPLYYWNKGMHHFNDRLYFWLLKPAAKGYKAVTPQPVRTSIKNFFSNLTAPVRFVNCLLQGKSETAGVELGRFMVNTTIGGLGFWDPAGTEPALQVPPKEDFGQTLGVYGIGHGMYIVWPLLGPSSLRDTVGLAGDYWLTPVNHIDIPVSAAAGANALDRVNSLSFHIGDYETLKDSAIDPYEAFRDAFLQMRMKGVKE